MYDKSIAVLGSSATMGTLAYTGAADVMWMTLGGFALVAAGLAVVRILPRQQA